MLPSCTAWVAQFRLLDTPCCAQVELRKVQARQDYHGDQLVPPLPPPAAEKHDDDEQTFLL